MHFASDCRTKSRGLYSCANPGEKTLSRRGLLLGAHKQSNTTIPMNQDTITQSTPDVVVLPPPSRIALVSAVSFAVCNLLLSIVFEDLYPFTIAPMFRDNPQLYCDYQVLDPQGTQLSLRDFQLQRNYDGNPLGLGAGVRPPHSLDTFGSVPDEAMLIAHVSRILPASFPELRYVDVVQTVTGPVDENRVGIVKETRYRVNADGK